MKNIQIFDFYGEIMPEIPFMSESFPAEYLKPKNTFDIEFLAKAQG